ncbi:MAG: HD-GYP domain-containing protein [Gammaproteobacteria bacterium]|nr:HD-GYP domain-containing protein [Gammaproteobacteria bacterium]
MNSAKQQVSCQELELGMYVAELDRPWLETPFLFQGFEIKTREEIEELKRFCQFVYVDPLQSNIAIEPAAKPATRIETGWVPRFDTKDHLRPDLIDTEEESDNARLEFEVLKKQVQPEVDQAYADRTDLLEEIERIRDAHEFVQALIPALMEDARMGRAIKTDAARKAIGAMTSSIIRNPDALMCFTQLKHKDAYTAEHSVRVSVLALAFGRHLGLAREELEALGLGALLHDIGKTRVPTEVLIKPDGLTENETRLMRQHVAYGVQILESTDIPAAAIDVVAQHHERYDGLGYARGLKGDQISQFGMIGAMSDFYDALTSDRPYKNSAASHKVLRDMYKFRGSLFEPDLVERFIQCIGIYPIGSVVELSNGEIGVVQTINRLRRLKPSIAMALHADHSPYTKRVTIDLVDAASLHGRTIEVVRVHDPETFGINPAYYLPIHRAA